jgi:hypothetical protein
LQPKKVLHFFFGFVDVGLGSVVGLAAAGFGSAGLLTLGVAV